MKSDWS